MKPEEQIIDFTETAINNVAKIDDIIDGILAPIVDYVETIEDIAAPVKAFISAYNLKKRLRLKAFIKSYAKKLSVGYEIDEEEKAKISTFLKDKKNLSYVSEIIENAINSRSERVAAILGVVAGKALIKKEDVSYDDLCIIETLKVMTDFDIDNFEKLFEYLEIAPTAHPMVSEYSTKEFYEEGSPQINIEREFLNYTIEKLKRTNALTYNEGGIGYGGNAMGYFEVNQISKKLYELIKATTV